MRIYRTTEQRRIGAVLRSGSSLLVVGESGIGKSVLVEAVAQELKDEGYQLALIQPASTKQLLTLIAEQLEIDTQDLAGKNLTTVGLRSTIADFLRDKTTFLVCDDLTITPQSSAASWRFCTNRDNPYCCWQRHPCQRHFPEAAPVRTQAFDGCADPRHHGGLCPRSWVKYQHGSTGRTSAAVRRQSHAGKAGN